MGDGQTLLKIRSMVHFFTGKLMVALGMTNNMLVQAVRGFSVHFWKKLSFFAQMISNMYSFDPDIAQLILPLLTPN